MDIEEENHRLQEERERGRSEGSPIAIPAFWPAPWQPHASPIALLANGEQVVLVYQADPSRVVGAGTDQPLRLVGAKDEKDSPYGIATFVDVVEHHMGPSAGQGLLGLGDRGVFEVVETTQASDDLRRTIMRFANTTIDLSSKSRGCEIVRTTEKLALRAAMRALYRNWRPSRA